MSDEGFARTAAGRVHYVRHGGGMPLVLLHSNGNSFHEYDAVAADLADAFDVIRWDMPGQGDSDPLPRHLTIDDYADAVVALLDHVGVERAIVAGASVGGCIVASFGARWAGRALGLGIIETQYRTYEWWQAGWENIERLFSTPLQTSAQVEARFHSAAPELVERVNIDRHKAGGRSMMSAMWAIREFDIRAAVPKIAAPTLLLFGTAGPTFETAPQLQQDLASPSVLRTVEGAGHFPMVDHPAEFVTALREFAEGLRAPG